MKAVLDEMSIRRLVREGIVRRMLNEAPEDYSGIPTFDFSNIIGFGGGEKKAGSPTGTLAAMKKRKEVSPYGKRGSETVYDAIARVALGDENARSDIDEETGEEIIGERVGNAIVEMLANPREGAKSEFKPSSWERVMDEWQSIASSIPQLPLLGPDGKPSGDQVDFPPDENGLLRYLIAIRSIELGYAILREHYENTTGLIEELEPTREALDDIFDTFVFGMYTSNQELRDAVGEILGFINEKDQAPDLEKTKMLLAYFASQNTTGSEGLKNVLTVTGIVVGVIAVVIGIAATGGLLAGGLAGAGTAAGVAGTAAAAETVAVGGAVGSILAAEAIGAGAISGLLAGIGTAASYGFVAASAATITYVAGGAYLAQWCGNQMPMTSDKYKEFMSALEDKEGLSELREEFTSVYEFGDDVTSEIINLTSRALQKIENGKGQNIRAEVIQLLKKAQNV